METTTNTKPDALCTSVIVLKVHIQILEEQDDPMLRHTVETLKRVLESITAVHDGLRQTFIQSRDVEISDRLRAILYPLSSDRT
jgi:hypothetical protein